MNERANDILDLINKKGKAAPDMTSSLKKIGDGDMQVGLQEFASYFKKTGFKSGEKIGFLKGASTVAGAICVFKGGKYLKDKYSNYKYNKELDNEGKKIYDAFKSTVSIEKNVAEVKEFDNDFHKEAITNENMLEAEDYHE